MPANPARPNPHARASVAQGILAVSRLVAIGESRADLQLVRESLVAETRALLSVRWAALLAVKDGGKRAIAVWGDAHGGFPIEQEPPLTRLCGRRSRVPHLSQSSGAAALVDALVGDGAAAGSALLVRLRLISEEHILVLADSQPAAFAAEAIASVEALVDASAEALARGRAADVDARHAACQSALTRAAKTLHESLDLETVLSRFRPRRFTRNSESKPSAPEAVPEPDGARPPNDGAQPFG